MNKRTKSKDLTELLFNRAQKPLEEPVKDEDVEEQLLDEEAKTEEAVEQLQRSYPHSAIGMFPVFENGGTKFVIVEIPYDPKTGDVGFVKEVYKDIREDSIDKFKTLVVEKGFFGL